MILLAIIVVLLTSSLFLFLKYRTVGEELNILDKITLTLRDHNSYSIKIEDTLNKDVKILYCFDSERNNKIMLLDDNKFRGRVINYYGKHFFEIYYDQKQRFDLIYFKKRKWVPDFYKFYLKRFKDSMLITLRIENKFDTINLCAKNRIR